jgi:hypothetical protein
MTTANQRISRSRRAALTGGAAVLVTAVAAHAVMAQEASAPDCADLAAAAQPDGQVAPVHGKDVLVWASGTSVATAPADLEQERQKWLTAVANKVGTTSDKLDQAIQDVAREVGPVPLLGVGVPGMQAKPAFTVRIASPFAAAAKAIGISENQLRQEQKGGKSLGEIARGAQCRSEGSCRCHQIPATRGYRQGGRRWDAVEGSCR